MNAKKILALLLGAMIIAVCAFWGSRCRETTFIPSLTQLLGRPPRI